MKKIISILLLMGILTTIFSCLRSKSSANKNEEDIKNINSETYYVNYLRTKLTEVLNTKYSALNFKIINEKIVSENGISIECYLANHNKFQSSESFQINFLTNYKDFFNNGIEERLAGIGENDTSAITYGIESFINGQFSAIIDGISLKHSTYLDFDLFFDNRKIHWHSILGPIQLQGELSKIADSTIYDKTFNLLKPKILEKIKNSKYNFHWIRYYISKNANNEIIGDCYFDNEVFEEGQSVIEDYAKNWKTGNNFAGQKQLIIFRKCGE